MSRQPINISELTAQVRALEVTAGSVLLVHTSFSKVGPVEDGPLGLIRALQAALWPNGTLVMPSTSATRRVRAPACNVPRDAAMAVALATDAEAEALIRELRAHGWRNWCANSAPVL